MTASLTYVVSTNAALVAGAVTFTAINIGTSAADRQVIAAISGNIASLTSNTSVKIQGKQALIHVASTTANPTSIIASILVASGATADVVITTTGTSAVQVAIDTYTLTGTADRPKVTSQAGASGVTSISFTPVIPTGGVGVALFCEDTGTLTTTWTNATADSDFNIASASSHRHSGAHPTTTGSVTITASHNATTTKALIGAFWGPFDLLAFPAPEKPLGLIPPAMVPY